MEKKRLSKALAAAGIASRRACEEIIFEGRVQVNGETVRVPQTMVDLETDRVQVDGSAVKNEQKKVCYLFNKPPGVICSNARIGKKPIVLDFFPSNQARLFTVGRLDKDSEGLILVTNDGHFANEVIHPSAGITKEYLVKTLHEITPEHLKSLSKGARVDEKWVRPVSVKKVRKGTFRISIREGKKHEVRIIAERSGLKVIELKRIRIGGLMLGTLPVGKYRPLTKADKQGIFSR